MQNLPKDMEFLARVAATAGNPNPYDCGLTRATGCSPMENYIKVAKQQFGWSAAKCYGIAAGWDHAQGYEYRDEYGKTHNIMAAAFPCRLLQQIPGFGTQADFDAGWDLGVRAAALVPGAKRAGA